MKYFLVLLAVAAVFAQLPNIDTSIEDKQQEIDKLSDDKQQEIDKLSDDKQQEVDTPFDDNKQEEDKSIEDNQEDLDLETLTNEDDDDSNQQAVIPASTNLCSINVPALTALINGVINKKLASQPVVQMLYLAVHRNRELSIRKIRGGSFTLGPVLDKISIGKGLAAKKSSKLAYIPRYNDLHHTRRGAVFLNLEKLFPCAGKGGLVPVCRRFTYEEDGFYKGRTITEAADGGNNIKVFGNGIKTYGFIFQGCSCLSGQYACLPTWFETVITCFLPRRCL